jgi:hypothetical protein
MSNKEQIVVYSPALAKEIGLFEAILIALLEYWTPRSQNGWVYKSREELEKETGLSFSQQRSARQSLKNLGLINCNDYDRHNHRLNFKLNKYRLQEIKDRLGSGEIRNCHERNSQMAVYKIDGGSGENQLSYIEHKSTQETTHKTTTYDDDIEEGEEMNKSKFKKIPTSISPEEANVLLKIAEEWNELAAIYRLKPFTASQLEQLKDHRKIVIEKLLLNFQFMLDFVQSYEDWMEQWDEVKQAIKTNSYLQGKVNNFQVNMRWLFGNGKVNEMTKSIKFKGIQEILSGKYPPNARETPHFLKPENQYNPLNKQQIEEAAKERLRKIGAHVD